MKKRWWIVGAAGIVLAGAGDRLVDPRCSLAIARRWHCPLALHPEAGHDLPLDDGAWVAREVRGWCAGPPARGAHGASAGGCPGA